MKRKMINHRLAHAVEEATPEVWNQISSHPIQQMSQEEYAFYTTPASPTAKHTGKKTALTLTAVFACAALVFGLFLQRSYMASHRVDSTITIDVNPSIELTANEDNRVLSVFPKNEDAVTILDGMELKNTDIKVAVNAIIGSLVQHGYVTEQKNTVLLSVQNKDTDKAAELKKLLFTGISDTLRQTSVSPHILGQEIQPDQEIESLSGKYHMSEGKAAFLLKILQKEPSLTFEQLAPLSIEEIARLITERNINLQDVIDYEGDDSIEDNIEDNIEDYDESKSESDDDECSGCTNGCDCDDCYKYGNRCPECAPDCAHYVSSPACSKCSSNCTCEDCSDSEGCEKGCNDCPASCQNHKKIVPCSLCSPGCTCDDCGDSGGCEKDCDDCSPSCKNYRKDND